MRMKISGWKLRIILLFAFALFSFFSLSSMIWRRNASTSPRTATVVCTLFEGDEPADNASVALELLTANGTNLVLSGVSGSNGSVSIETPFPVDVPVLLKRVVLRNTWVIQAVIGDRVYRLPERLWNLTDPQEFLNGCSSYAFKGVRLHQSQTGGRLYLSLKLFVAPARLIAVYNSPTQLGGISFLAPRSAWRIEEYVHFELEDLNFVPVQDSVLVVVPTGQPLRITVLAKVFDFTWRLKIEAEVADRDLLDLSAPIVRAISEAQIQQLYGDLDTLAADGFDVKEQYDKVGKTRQAYEKAALDMELGNYTQGFELMQTAWGGYTEVFFYIREIYANTLPWTISVTLILAFFSVTVTYLLSEQGQVRNLLASSVFLLFLLIFAYMQPSVRLFISALLGVAEKLDIYLLISLIQMLPWIVVAVALSSYPKFRDLLWETFGVTTRNMRRRKLRTLLTLSMVVVVSASAMCLLSIAPYVPSNRVAVSGLKPTVPNGLVVSRYEVLTPRPTGGYEAARGQTYPLTIQAHEAEWMMTQPPVAQANTYGLKQVKVSNSTGHSLPDFSIVYIAVVNPSFVKEHCTLGSLRDSWLEEDEGNAVLIGSKIAETYRIRLGDEILLDDRTFKVKSVFDEAQVVNEWRDIDGDNFFVGIYDPSTQTIPGGSFLIGSIHDFQPDAVNIHRISLILNDIGKLDDFVENVLQRGYSHEFTLLYEITRTYFLHVVKNGVVVSAYYGQSLLALTGPWYSQTVVIVLSAMMIFVNVFASVSERKRDILAMHVSGASPLRIRLVFIAEALVTGLMGGIYGYVLGYLFADVARLASPGAVQSNLSSSTPFTISLSASVVSSVLGSVLPSKKAILTVVPSRRMLQRTADVFSMKGGKAFIEVPIRIGRSELGSFNSFLQDFAERFPPVRYSYDGLSVLRLDKEESERELTYTIEVNYAVERSLYYRVRVLLAKDDQPRKVQISVYPLDPWEHKVTLWSREHAGLLPRLAACLRIELLKYAQWKGEPQRF